MAIVRDSSVATANLGTSGSASWNHTVASGGVLYVYIALFYATDPLTAITFDGVAMTLIKKETSNSRSIYCYGTLNPTTGSAKSVSVTWNTTGTPTCYGASVSYTGVSTSGFSAVTPVEVHNVGDTSSISTSITTTVDNSVVLGLATADNNTISTYTGITNVGALTTMVPYESNPLLVTPAGSKTVGVGSGAADWFKLIAFVAEPGGTSYTMTASTSAFTLTGNATLFYKSMRMIASVGSFTLTGINVLFRLGKGITAETGTFIISGKDAILRYSGWTPQSKNTASWSSTNKNSASWTAGSKH